MQLEKQITKPLPEPPHEHLLELARQLLQRISLEAAGEVYRLREIEFYYHSPQHPDPFAHQHPLQLSSGRWYLHRAATQHREGTFKGLDLTFGPPDAFGGILLRTLEGRDGLINGSCLWVDHVLEVTGCDSVASLDALIGDRSPFAADCPIRLVHSDAGTRAEVLATARVGLTLKRAASHPLMSHFIMKPYRFLDLFSIPKGRVQTIIALHRRGHRLAEIQSWTGSRRETIRSYIASYQDGQRERELSAFIGRSLSTREYCRLAGACER